MTDQPAETTPAPVQAQPPKKKNRWGCAIIFAIVFVIITTQITFFAIQPIGAIPDGITLVMLRGKNTKLFDSPDAMCERINNGVSLLCRGAVLAAVAENSTILLRLPYMPFVYLISTGGSTYEN